MHHFSYKQTQLFAEEVALKDIAARVGTPFYVYSARTLRRHFRVFDEAFAGTDHLICYAMKALSNLSILKLFASMGSGFDIVSVGELMRCLKAGADPRKIVFSGVGKTDEEIAAALDAGILMINVESRPELYRIAAVARRKRKRAPVSLRVNPDLDPGTHPHISTGHRDSKFGVPLAQVLEYYAEAARPERPRSGRPEHAYRLADHRNRAIQRSRREGRGQSSSGCGPRASRSNTSISAAGWESLIRRNRRRPPNTPPRCWRRFATSGSSSSSSLAG